MNKRRIVLDGELAPLRAPVDKPTVKQLGDRDGLASTIDSANIAAHVRLTIAKQDLNSLPLLLAHRYTIVRTLFRTTAETLDISLA